MSKYRVIKRMEISGAHRLSLPYESKCRGLHGHNWIITVFCESETLDENGMVVDFSKVKELVHGKLDHRFLNDVIDVNPTAENMARWICDRVPHCYKVQIQESEGNIVEYEK